MKLLGCIATAALYGIALPWMLGTSDWRLDPLHGREPRRNLLGPGREQLLEIGIHLRVRVAATG